MAAKNNRLQLGADAPHRSDEISQSIQRLYSTPQSSFERLPASNLVNR